MDSGLKGSSQGCQPLVTEPRLPGFRLSSDMLHPLALSPQYRQGTKLRPGALVTQLGRGKAGRIFKATPSPFPRPAD